MAKQSVADRFGENVGEIIADKICGVYPLFDKKNFVQNIKKQKNGKRYTERVILIAEELRNFCLKSTLLQ